MPFDGVGCVRSVPSTRSGHATVVRSIPWRSTMNGGPSLKKCLGAKPGGFAVVAVLTFLLPLGAAAQNGNWNPQDILAAKEWVAPPGNIAEAVLAPRYLNVTLNEISADRSWFVHEIGDGPVPMDRFSKPFDELGGLFIDFGGNRNRTLTIRSNVGLEVISAADGRKVTGPGPQRRPGLQRHVVARRRPTGVLRPYRRRHPHLRRRPGQRPRHGRSPASPVRGHGGHVLRVDRGRPEDRHGPGARRALGPPAALGGADRPAGEADRRGREHPPDLRQPHEDAVRRGASGVARHRPARPRSTWPTGRSRRSGSPRWSGTSTSRPTASTSGSPSWTSRSATSFR